MNTRPPKTLAWVLIFVSFGITFNDLHGQGLADQPNANVTTSPISMPKHGLTPDLAYHGLLVTEEEFLSQKRLLERDTELENAMAKGEHPQMPSDFASSKAGQDKLRLLALSLRNRVKILRNALESDKAVLLTPDAKSEMLKAINDVLSMKALNDVLPAELAH